MNELTQAELADLKNRFTYHAPKPGQAERYTALRNTGLALAIAISQEVPAGRERALALTNLEQTIFWANAGIARNE